MQNIEQSAPAAHAVGIPVERMVRPADPERAAFEGYFADSRRGKGPSKRPTFAKLADGTYADDSTQRHWWTWQQALAAERERLRHALTIEMQHSAWAGVIQLDDALRNLADALAQGPTMGIEPLQSRGAKE